MVTGQDSSDRQRLLAAAETLAGRLAPAQLQIADLADAAGVPLARTAREFESVAGYFAALQTAMFEGRLAAVIEHAGALAPGMNRVRESLGAYLDYSVSHHAIYRWCGAARGAFPALAAEVERRNHGAKAMMTAEFRALGWAYPAECARLTLALVVELVGMETEAGAAITWARSALWQCLETFAQVRADRALGAARGGVGRPLA